MDDFDSAQLQIYSVEERTTMTAVCIVRCVGGIAHTGQKFDFTAPVDQIGSRPRMTLDWILRYERPADSLEPPHSAKVHLSGEGIEDLKRGAIITATSRKHDEMG